MHARLSGGDGGVLQYRPVLKMHLCCCCGNVMFHLLKMSIFLTYTNFLGDSIAKRMLNLYKITNR